MFGAAYRSSSGWVPTQPGQQPVTTCVYKPEAANTVWSSWWRAVCRSKHVELSINFGITNSITRLHLVGYFYDARIHKYKKKHINCIYSLWYYTRESLSAVYNTIGYKYGLDVPDNERKYCSKHVEQPRNNKLSYATASCWSFSYIIRIAMSYQIVTDVTTITNCRWIRFSYSTTRFKMQKSKNCYVWDTRSIPQTTVKHTYKDPFRTVQWVQIILVNCA